MRRQMLAKLQDFGEDWVLDQVGQGRTLASIAQQVGITRPKLNAWLLEDSRRDRYARAQELAASSLVDESLEIVDGADPQTVQVAKLRADTRRWIAGKLNREQWGDKEGPQVAIQINTLHADLLRRRDEG